MGYVPRKASELSNWSRNFANRIGELPERFGLSAQDAAQIQAVVAAFQEAYWKVTTPGSRTATAVAAKDAAARAMLEVVRSYAMSIKGSPTVADTDKANLGLQIRRGSLARLPAPVTAPLISVESGQLLCHVLRFRDAAAPERRGRPRGASGVELYCYLGETAPQKPEEAQHATFCSRTFYRYCFQPGTAGQRAHYWARWRGYRGLVGPWSQRVSLAVAG